MKRFLPWLISLVVVIWISSRMIPHKPAPGFDVEGFGQLPVLVGGRVMPMDSLARLSLALMNHHGTFTAADGRTQPASRWLLDVFMMPRRADAAKVFEVASPDILALFGRQQAGGKYYQIVLRPKRFYTPFSIQLVQFSHDRYAGTDIARNFSSRV